MLYESTKLPELFERELKRLELFDDVETLFELESIFVKWQIREQKKATAKSRNKL